MKSGRKARKSVITRLSDYEYEKLNELVGKTGLSKSEIVRFGLLGFEKLYKLEKEGENE